MWILFSDQILLLIAPTRNTYQVLQSLKGSFYVGATAVLLYFLISSEVRKNAALLNELDHRVNNNLQIMHSLVNLRLRELPQGHPAAPHLKQVGEQLRTLSTAHQLAYHGDNLGTVDIVEFLSMVASGTVPRPEPPDPVPPRSVSVESAIPAGLITNAIFAHGYTDTDTPSISFPTAATETGAQMRSTEGPGATETGAQMRGTEGPAAGRVHVLISARRTPELNEALQSVLVASCLDQLDGEVQGRPDGSIRVRFSLLPVQR
jgi:hypothetical protein